MGLPRCPRIAKLPGNVLQAPPCEGIRSSITVDLNCWKCELVEIAVTGALNGAGVNPSII